MTVIMDMGTQGHTFEVTEQNLADVFTSKLKIMEKNGTLAAMQEDMRKTAQDRIMNPAPLGIPVAAARRGFLMNPAIVLPSDITDHKGRVIASAGTEVNPLDYRKLSKPLVFADASHAQSVLWLEAYLQKHPDAKVILTGGSPVRMEERYEREFYYDQKAAMIRRFGITCVPAVVTQEGRMLRIEEIPPGDPGEPPFP